MLTFPSTDILDLSQRFLTDANLGNTPVLLDAVYAVPREDSKSFNYECNLAGYDKEDVLLLHKDGWLELVLKEDKEKEAEFPVSRIKPGKYCIKLPKAALEVTSAILVNGMLVITMSLTEDKNYKMITVT